MSKSITDVKLKCPECNLIVSVGDAEPDIDGDGSLGCPTCLPKKIVLKEIEDGQWHQGHTLPKATGG